MKKNKRKIAVVILAVITALSCFGCAKDKNIKNEPEENPDKIEREDTKEKAEIHIFQYKVEIKDSLQAACDLYMEENPNITIHLETIQNGDSYETLLKKKMSLDEQIDIFNIQGPQDFEIYKDQLEDLSKEPWVDNSIEQVLDNVTIGKEIYGLPYGLEGYGLIYNKRIFEAAGIDVLDLTNFEAINNAFEKLQSKIDNKDLKEQFPMLSSVVEMAGGETWVIGTHTGNAVLSNEFQSAAEAFQAKTVELKYADQYQKLIDLQADYSRYKERKPYINNITYEDQINSIALERTAVIQQGNWISGEVAEISEEVAQQLGILPLSLYNINENCIPVGVPRYWCINKESSQVNKEAAKDFLNWLYQSETGKSIIVNEFGFIPAFHNYEEYPVKDLLGRAVMKYVNAGQVTNWVSSGLPDEWAEKSLGENIQSYIAGKIPWEKVMDAARKDWEQIRKESLK